MDKPYGDLMMQSKRKKLLLRKMMKSLTKLDGKKFSAYKTHESSTPMIPEIP